MSSPFGPDFLQIKVIPLAFRSLVPDFCPFSDFPNPSFTRKNQTLPNGTFHVREGQTKVRAGPKLTRREGTPDYSQRLMESRLSEENQVQRRNTITPEFKDPDGPQNFDNMPPFDQTSPCHLGHHGGKGSGRESEPAPVTEYLKTPPTHPILFWS